jgi:eukaryotic-like serine/threonine-protein kinase
MTDDRVQALSDRLSALATKEREHALAALEPAVAGAIRARLAASAGAETQAPPATGEGDTLAPEAMPVRPAGESLARLGAYRILERIGSGGMGAVWLALQQNPERRVALKTIRPELLTPRMRERFTHEARFLAALEHPGIARILEAGSAETAEGETPYLAMEYVAGRPLLEAAELGGWDLGRRLRVLIAIAGAVQHAHTRGVIHRDLKPANILVDAGGQPKILDFGIARAVSEEGPAATRLTHAGEVVGTVWYMSPEQLSGDPLAVDLRSDVYALGVILYELLSGELPYAIRESSLIEAIRTREKAAPRPLSALRPEYRGEIETVVMKALASEPAQRYQSAAALAEDLERFLDHRPILARPPSAGYLLAKFVRRHRVAVAAAALVLLALVGATVVSLRAAEQARAALAEAEARAAELGAVNDFVEQMLTSADPETGGSSALPLGDVLAGAERALAGLGSERAAGQVAMLLGRTWSGLGDSVRAEALYERAATLLATGFGAGSAEALDLERLRAEELGKKGDIEGALAAFDAVLRRHREAGGEYSLAAERVRLAQAQVMQAKGEAEAALAQLEQTLARAGDALAREAPGDYDGARYNLAYTKLFLGDFPAAEALLREVMASETARLGADHPQTLYTVKALGQALHRQGRLDEAEPLYRLVWEKRRAAYGPGHRSTLNAASQLGAGLVALGRPEEAEPIQREVLAAFEALGETATPQYIGNLNILGSGLARMGRLEEALELAARAIAIEAEIGAPNQDTLAARNQHATLLLRLGRAEQAATEYAELLPLTEATVGSGHVHYPNFLSQAAEVDLALGRRDAARAKLEIALPALTQRFGPEHPRTREAAERMARAEGRSGG